MIIKLKVRAFNGSELVSESIVDHDHQFGWYGCQNYFNDNYKDYLLENDDGVDTIIINWNYSNYEFTTRKR